MPFLLSHDFIIRYPFEQQKGGRPKD